MFAVPVVGIATGSWRLLPILSGSMAPELPTGSLALATPVRLTELHVGEVIAYQAPVADHHLTAHRIVRILTHGAEPILQTKGDANAAADPWNLRLGAPTAWVVRGGVPLLGYAAIYARRALALILVLLTVTAIALAVLRRIWRQPATLGDHDHRHASLPG